VINTHINTRSKYETHFIGDEFREMVKTTFDIVDGNKVLYSVTIPTKDYLSSDDNDPYGISGLLTDYLKVCTDEEQEKKVRQFLVFLNKHKKEISIGNLEKELVECLATRKELDQRIDELKKDIEELQGGES